MTTAWYGPKAPGQWRERAEAAKDQGPASLIDFQVTRWFSDSFRAAHPERVRALTEVFLANDVACYAASCEMLGDADLRPCLGSITKPTSVIVGEEDYATPVEMARQLHEGIRGSTLTVLHGARHITPVEWPDEIAEALLKLAA